MFWVHSTKKPPSRRLSRRSKLRNPISVEVVEAGVAGDLNHGAPASVMAADRQAIDRLRERASRPAWRVVLTGVRASRTRCLEIIIDRDSGAVLYSSPCPGNADSQLGRLGTTNNRG